MLREDCTKFKCTMKSTVFTEIVNLHKNYIIYDDQAKEELIS